MKITLNYYIVKRFFLCTDPEIKGIEEWIGIKEGNYCLVSNKKDAVGFVRLSQAKLFLSLMEKEFHSVKYKYFWSIDTASMIVSES